MWQGSSNMFWSAAQLGVDREVHRQLVNLPAGGYARNDVDVNKHVFTIRTQMSLALDPSCEEYGCDHIYNYMVEVKGKGE